ncbi:MAG: phosphoribosylformylglycinamidine synthase II, partial [Okeania sp. SIO2D1]|nr:phosphoribosylformylglycinamidine synthase II [Okeania sp. SIO2D1]
LAAIVRLRPADGSPKTSTRGVAATTDCNPRYCYLDPYEGAKAAVAEAARNLSCVGAYPVAITDNLNFGSPEKPIGYWQLAMACQGIAAACQELKTPVTGGNVSLYNETLDKQGKPQPIYPSPVIGMVGLVEDITKVCGQGWQHEGDLIYLLGQSETQNLPTLGGSQYLATIHGIVAGKPPRVDLAWEAKVQEVCREGIRKGWVKSAHDLAEGGIAFALAEACLSSHLGADINLEMLSTTATPKRWDEILFGEAASLIITTIGVAQQAAWETYLRTKLDAAWQKIGIVTGKNTQLRVYTSQKTPLIKVNISEASDRSNQAISRHLSS